MEVQFPFLYGAQYYRAPTPERAHWKHDLRRMAESGFNAVKFWAQWRWAHRSSNSFYFDDLDELMDLAARYGLSVTINAIFDVAPGWLFKAHADCMMITSSGRRLEPSATICRQIGGYPGPCLNHPQARYYRMQFLEELARRYANHPAMGMWDVWNEPESNLLMRIPSQDTLLCYCDNCKSGFIIWLKERYQDIDCLDRVWGRCYESWDDVELPRDRWTLIDMLDWREFQCESFSREADRRIGTVKSIDTIHPVYLHTVPNTLEHVNSVTGPDDFRITDNCDCLAGTILGVPSSALQAMASCRDRVVYNVESHLRAGSTTMFPRSLSPEDIAFNFVPQIGLGVRGFLFWQYRCETLGAESPAWGLLDIDGQAGTAHQAAAEFWQRLKPFAGRLMTASPAEPEVALWRSTANEIFHWCMYGNLDELREGLHGYSRLLYDRNARFAYFDGKALTDGLPSSVRLLVMPNAYLLSQRVADAVVEWVRSGGVLLCEAHTGGYNRDAGRHSLVMPGFGLAEAFGFRERNACAVPHLGLSDASSFGQYLTPDLQKALDAAEVAGGNILPLTLNTGEEFLGWSRYAELDGEDLDELASIPGHKPCAAIKQVGSGRVYYLGTLAGRMWRNGASPGLGAIIDRAMNSAGINAVNHVPDRVRVDYLNTTDGICIAVTNNQACETRFKLHCDGVFTGIFTGQRLDETGEVILGGQQAEILVA